MVAGAVEPAMGAEERATGIPLRTISTKTFVVLISSLSGLTIQEVIKEMNGASRNLSSSPATIEASSITSRADWTV